MIYETGGDSYVELHKAGRRAAQQPEERQVLPDAATGRDAYMYPYQVPAHGYARPISFQNLKVGIKIGGRRSVFRRHPSFHGLADFPFQYISVGRACLGADA